MRELLSGYLTAEFHDRPDLLEQVIPTYPPFSKRFILDDGVWARTLKQDHVHLVSDGIAEITPEGRAHRRRDRPRGRRAHLRHRLPARRSS